MMETSLEHRDSCSQAPSWSPSREKVTMWSEQHALPRKALGLFGEEKEFLNSFLVWWAALLLFMSSYRS